LDIGFIYSLKTTQKIFINTGVLLPFNFYKGELPFNKGGFRVSAQYRKYNKEAFFYAFELRYRYVAFDNVGKSFKNTIDSSFVFLKNPSASGNIFASSFLIGGQKSISKNKKWIIEAIMGIGIRLKKISYKETTPTFFVNSDIDRRSIFPSKDEDGNKVYIPATMRLIYFL
jgi:hypothetical protein